MAQPPPYIPVHSFVSDSATLANFPGQALDVEFQDIKTTTDAISANLALIQRDDGFLANGSVGFDQLSESLQTNGLAPATGWATATVYAAGVSVLQGGALYRCLVTHTSGVFATDLAAGKWLFVTAIAVPPPSPTALGGVHSLASAPHKWIDSIGVDGTATQSQPAFSDIFGKATPTQLPNGATLGYLLQSNGSGNDPSYAGFQQSGSGSAIRTWQDKAREFVSLKDFGAVGDGVANDTAAITAALATGKPIYVPAGTYLTTGGHSIATNGQALVGASRGQVTFKVTNASSPFLTVAPTNDVILANFTVDRSVTATAGGDGIACSGDTNNALFADLFITRQYRGLALGSTQQGMVRYVTISNCESHGLLMQNNATVSQLQWFLDTIGIGTCKGNGFFADTSNGAAVAFLNSWRNCFTFANSGTGIRLVGTAASPIGDARITDGFFGADGNGEIAIANPGATVGAGGDHHITNCFFESAGGQGTGPGLATPASNTGIGISIDASVTRATISGNRIGTMSGPGIVSSAAITVITGNKLSDNCQGGAGAGSLVGISITGGRATITGNFSGNTFAGTQNFGAAIAVDNGHVIVGNDFTGNNTSPIFPATLPSSIVAYNSPVVGNGNIGDYVESVVAAGSAVSLVSGTPKNMTSISLPPGDWDVDSVINFTGGATTTVLYIAGSISTTTNTLDSTNGRLVSFYSASAALFNNVPLAAVPIPPLRLSLAATTTVYAVAQSIFGTSTATAFGVLRARRVHY